MTAELCYIGKTGTHRISSVSTRLRDIATFVDADAVDHNLAILYVNVGNNNTVPYIFSSRPTNTAFTKWQGNLRYMFVAGYDISERLTFNNVSRAYYLVDMPTAIVDLYFRFRAKYSITVNTVRAGLSTHILVVRTDSTIRVDLQYNDKPIHMGRKWYCRLKLYLENGGALSLLYTSKTVEVAAESSYCTIPKIEYHTGEYSTAIDPLPVHLYLEYSFNNSSWTQLRLHMFTEASDQAITCDEKTTASSYNLETVYD